MPQKQQKILVSFFPLFHGLSFIKHTLAQFYIYQPNINSPNFYQKDISQEQAQQIWDKYNSGFMFDKIYILTPSDDFFKKMTGHYSRKISLLYEDEIIKSDPILFNAWKQVIEKNFSSIQQEVNFIKQTFPELQDKMIKLYWRNIQHYLPNDQIWWLENISNLPKEYFKRFNFLKVKKQFDYRDYQSTTNTIYLMISKIIKDNPNSKIFINVGLSGNVITTVWFVLGQAGLLPENVSFFEAYDVKNSNPGHRFQKFYIKTFPKTIINQLVNQIKLYDFKPTTQIRAIIEDKFQTYLKQGFAILLLGERGIGKSYIAQKYSELEKLNFVAVNCASFIDSQIAEAELFGYKKGAFTDAKTDKKGLIEEANNGILFLDEIHTLPKTVQFKLMRAFATDEQNRMTVRRIGEKQERKITLKALILATNRTINELRQLLLPDFFDRIAQLIIELPPLRQTPEEIIPAFKQIWEQLRFNEFYFFYQFPGKDNLLLSWLKTLPLYGNYRDLQKIAINYKAYLDFPESLKQKLPEKSAFEYTKSQFENYLYNTKTNTLPNNPYFSTDKSIKQMLKEFKRDLAKWAINTFGTAKKAAEHFQKFSDSITQVTLYNWKNAK